MKKGAGIVCLLVCGLIGLWGCILPSLCRAAGRETPEDPAIAYFAGSPAGRHAIYAFLYDRQKAAEADPAGTQRVQQVLAELIHVAENPENTANTKNTEKREEGAEMPYREMLVLVTPKKTFNAYALPGGIFVVNQGALSILSDEELAVILAHELGHQVLGHPVAAMKRSLLSCRYLRRAAKAQAKDDSAAAAEAYWQAMQLSNVLKREEREADVWAARLLLRSGRDPAVAVNLWQRLENLYGAAPNGGNHLSYKERKRLYAGSQ